MNKLENLKQQVRDIRWFHTINLGHGIVTPGEDNSQERLETLQLPTNLQGKTVLDIGAWDGFFSFEAEKRGAGTVLATDSFCWGGEGWGTKEGFQLARKTLESEVQDKEIDVMDLSPESVGKFDIVFFLGILYHMRHPLLALEKVYSVTNYMLILETHADLLNLKQPAMRFYPKDELDADTTSWWGPNPAAVKLMLKEVGFHKAQLIHPHKPWWKHSLLYRVARAARHKMATGRAFTETLNQDRVVFHAWKD